MSESQVRILICKTHLYLVPILDSKAIDSHFHSKVLNMRNNGSRSKSERSEDGSLLPVPFIFILCKDFTHNKLETDTHNDDLANGVLQTCCSDTSDHLAAKSTSAPPSTIPNPNIGLYFLLAPLVFTLLGSRFLTFPLFTSTCCTSLHVRFGL